MRILFTVQGGEVMTILLEVMKLLEFIRVFLKIVFMIIMDMNMLPKK